MPVPAELGMTCETCGKDLTGLQQRACPDCHRPFNIPIPREFNLHCLTCGYELTGLTSRRCPECGSHFDVRGLLMAPRAYERGSLWNREAWKDPIQWIVAVAMAAVGTALGVRSLQFLIYTVPISAIIATRCYVREVAPPRIALYVAGFWLVSGLLAGVIW